MQAVGSCTSTDSTPLIERISAPPHDYGTKRGRALHTFDNVCFELEYTASSSAFVKDLEDSLNADTDREGEPISLLPMSPEVPTGAPILVGEESDGSRFDELKFDKLEFDKLKLEALLSLAGSIPGFIGGLFAGYIASQKIGSSVYLPSCLSGASASAIGSLVGRLFKTAHPGPLGRGIFGAIGGAAVGYSITASAYSVFKGHLVRAAALPFYVAGGTGVLGAIVSLFSRHALSLCLTSGSGSLIGLGVSVGTSFGNSTVDALIGSIAGSLLSPYAFLFTDLSL